MGHQLLHGKSNLKPLVEFMIRNAGTHALEQQHLLLLHFGEEGKGLMGENTQCLLSPVQALISGWEKQQPVTFQLFPVCLCICEWWICRTACLESSHSPGQVPQNPLGISGARRRDLDPVPSMWTSERCFCRAQCWSCR